MTSKYNVSIACAIYNLLLLCCHLVYPIVSIAISNDLVANRIFSHDIICIAVFITHLLCKLVT